MKVIITGVLGQDGSILAKYMLDTYQEIEIHGLYKRVSTGNTFTSVEAFLDDSRFTLVEGDICDYTFMTKFIKDVQPDHFYSLAAMSHVGYSFKIPAETFRVDAEAIIAQLTIIKDFSPKTKFYFACTSEIFGGIDCPEEGYDENSPLNPRSPYAIAKAAAFNSVKMYRKAYGLFVCSGILFNHSSVVRGEDFATRKITKGIANVVLGNQSHLMMGNMDAVRDEGCANDYVKAMHLILTQDEPDDYVVATGQTASIKEMFEYVCGIAGLTYKDVYRLDERFLRPSDVPFLKGNASKILGIGWKPEYDWKKLLSEMYENDLCSTTIKKAGVANAQS